MVVGEEGGKEEARCTADAEQEGSESDASERAVTAGPEVAWKHCALQLDVGCFLGAELCIELGCPFALVRWAVHRKGDVRVRGGSCTVLRHDMDFEAGLESSR